MYHNFGRTGLSDEEVAASRKLHGANILIEKRTAPYWRGIKNIVREPMFLLLVTAALVYFILGENREGIFMLVAITLVSGISYFQDTRSRKALSALQEATRIQANVLRASGVVAVDSRDIVKGDLVIIEEGSGIPADGTIVQCNDFTVNESMLTGESFAVSKSDSDPEANQVYQGTIALSGLALVEVTGIGTNTRLARIGRMLEEVTEERTPLQLQINRFVQTMAVIGLIIFAAVWIFNIVLSGSVLESLVKGLTLAMSILPEEIPVAFTTFMALGAVRLMKAGIVIKQIRTVETLGSATVICLDKTGTITENRMELTRIYNHRTGTLEDTGSSSNHDQIREIVENAMWASEPVPFDPMEIAIHNKYTDLTDHDLRRNAKMIAEYPLGGTPPIMTHVFEIGGGRTVVAAKGAPEGIVNCSRLTAEEHSRVDVIWKEMAAQGLRVLGVGISEMPRELPERQQEFHFTFLGFVGFFDPPKKNIPEVFQAFYNAGVKVKIITGDTMETTRYLADQIAFRGRDKALTGEELMQASDEELPALVQKTNVFARMFPEAKLRIVRALKRAGQIVAMTGDGVNDGPALKAAHIGVAMGKSGSEVAHRASSLIILGGDLSKMVEAVAAGRKIYANLKKAIRYIISIHIPIVMVVALPLFLGWRYPFLFTPVHVIFLELIMGPTCSIVYENEPLEQNLMHEAPRAPSTTFLKWHELRISLVQGLVITSGLFLVYRVTVANGAGEELVRTMVFATLVFANIALTLTNRSFVLSFIESFRKKNPLIGITLLIASLSLVAVVYAGPLRALFEFQALTLRELSLCFLVGVVSVFWFELVKIIKRKDLKRRAEH